MTHLFYSLINAAIAFFFMLVGLVSLSLFFSVQMRTDFIQFVLEDTVLLPIFGITLVAIGVGVLINSFFSLRRKTYRISSGNYVTSLDENLFKQYLETYWKQKFPQKEVPCTVCLKRNKILVSAELPFVPLAEQKAVLSHIDSDLSQILTQYLGYHRKYVINISFKPKPK